MQFLLDVTRAVESHQACSLYKRLIELLLDSIIT